MSHAPSGDVSAPAMRQGDLAGFSGADDGGWVRR